MVVKILKELKSFWDAVTFYTIIPIPLGWQGNFLRVAQWASWIGLGIGGLLIALDVLLQALGVPNLTRAVWIVFAWVGITRGLHLDGAMDTADGLAVTDPQRRLLVMQDSQTGAYGAIAAIVILGMKVAALSEQGAGWGLILAAGWGRWGQVLAIAFYPYLKPTGKGAFHKLGLKYPQDVLWGLWGLLIVQIAYGFFNPLSGWGAMITGAMGLAIAVASSYLFYRRLGGHTGDSYGAVVEWSEAIFLSGFATWVHWLNLH
jgi:adenosylcobinamide-GDP ribazoletransferase